ncbi:DarT ssDNA thymidine ADP-ribosyltransferase family protein [Nocardiopsis composta]|uniref:DarT domain-containing protein n=1 Tax=Nocardiopsis composta TaxID=157465 RepID=A0A7W8QIB4_9ACTN|nr:DarT ssDNA thymidine ADP-ribosyltransferase family protein [Nocardiopsis composta]MBB5430245.1 hypothetical protein [Nocardiopsis composta]
MGPVLEAARARGITRLCHFTRSNTFADIIDSGEIRSRAALEEGPYGFHTTDEERYDGHLEHVNCSVEYPNPWYFDTVRSKRDVFGDWMVLALDPVLLDREGALFCPVNAATGRGGRAEPGIDGFDALFAPMVTGKKVFTRRAGHPDWWPTDGQAEVLVPGPIPLTAVRAVLLASEGQAERELHRFGASLGMLDRLPPLRVAPALFDSDKNALGRVLRKGERPEEAPYPVSAPSGRVGP